MNILRNMLKKSIIPNIWKVIPVAGWIIFGLVFTYALTPRPNTGGLLKTFYYHTNWGGFILTLLLIYLAACVLHFCILLIKDKLYD